MDKSHQGGLRILFADDEAHLRDLMQMELPRLGHEVTVCPDGTAALKALEKGTYDAALLDLRMPGLTGIEVLGKVRQISPDTQVIILTGHATVDTAVQALRLGAFDYLTKPCKWAELEIILSRVAERRYPVPRRSRRAEQERAGQAPPLPGIRRDPPGRRERPVPGRRAGALRHQPRPPRDDRGRAVPRGLVLPAQYVRDPPPPPPRAEG